MATAIEALGLGLCIGVILGLTGAGGGTLAVPALVLVLGWSLPDAAPVALFAVGAAAAIGAYHGWRRREVRYRAAMVMAVVGGLFAPIGVAFANQLPRDDLTLCFCLVMVVVAWRMLSSTRRNKALATAAPSAALLPCRIDPATGRLRWTLSCAMVIGSIGAVAGFCSGMLGVGGGFVIVPAMSRFSSVNTHQIIATSLLAIALIALSSVLSALLSGVVVDATGASFIVGSIAGMLVGRSVFGFFSAVLLQRSFAFLMLLVALMLARGALLH